MAIPNVCLVFKVSHLAASHCSLIWIVYLHRAQTFLAVDKVRNRAINLIHLSQTCRIFIQDDTILCCAMWFCLLVMGLPRYKQRAGPHMEFGSLPLPSSTDSTTLSCTAHCPPDSCREAGPESSHVIQHASSSHRTLPRKPSFSGSMLIHEVVHCAFRKFQGPQRI